MWGVLVLCRVAQWFQVCGPCDRGSSAKRCGPGAFADVAWSADSGNGQWPGLSEGFGAPWTWGLKVVGFERMAIAVLFESALVCRSHEWELMVIDRWGSMNDYRWIAMNIEDWCLLADGSWWWRLLIMVLVILLWWMTVVSLDHTMGQDTLFIRSHPTLVTNGGNADLGRAQRDVIGCHTSGSCAGVTVSLIGEPIGLSSVKPGSDAWGRSWWTCSQTFGSSWSTWRQTYLGAIHWILGMLLLDSSSFFKYIDIILIL